MSDNLYISRSFTELGAFRPDEVMDFYTRRILNSSDFVRLSGTEEWLSLDEWMAGAAPGTAVSQGPEPKPELKAKTKAAKPKADKPKTSAKTKKPASV